MKILLSLFVLFFASSGYSKEISQDFVGKNYDEALAAKSYIKFDMESTKAGFITTGFTGVLKKFNVKTDLTNGVFSKTHLSFAVQDMDTDNGSRNDKMYNKCFSFKQYPQITMDLPSSVKLGETVTVPAILKLRGTSKKIQVNLSSKKDGNIISLSGKANLKLSELQIPDPSIFIAKVRDLIEVSFNLSIINDK